MRMYLIITSDNIPPIGIINISDKDDCEIYRKYAENSKEAVENLKSTTPYCNVFVTAYLDDNKDIVYAYHIDDYYNRITVATDEFLDDIFYREFGDVHISNFPLNIDETF